MSRVTWSERLMPRSQQPAGTRNDRFASILVVAVVITLALLGLALREQQMQSQWVYSSLDYGIEGIYPAGWLIDETGDYVVRIRDPRARPFKIQYQLAVVPAGSSTSVRNVLDLLTIQRAAELSAYRVLQIQEAGTAGLQQAQISFTFVDTDPNPFVQRLPVVVQGRDVIIPDGDRLIIATYLANESDFAAGLPGFVRFVQSLSY